MNRKRIAQYQQSSAAKRRKTSASPAQMAAFAAMMRPSQGLVRRSALTKNSGYVDVASATYALDSTGSVTLLNAVAQGAAVTQRIGKKILMTSIQMRGKITNNSAAITNDIAYMIVYDKRPRGSLPAITDILNSVSPNAFNNDNNAGRFKILKRVNEVLAGTPATTLGDGTIRGADWYLKMNLPVTYQAAGTGAIGDIEEGALYLVTVGSSAAGTTAAQLTCGTRVRFTDING